MRHSMVVLALLCTAPVMASAQQGPLALQPGDRVRIAPVQGESLATASVVAITPEAISLAFLDLESGVVERPYVNIDRIRVSQGVSRSASARRAAAFGAFVLGSAGVAFGPLASEPLGWTIGRTMATFATAGVIGGGTAGAAFGAVAARERWKTYSIQH